MAKIIIMQRARAQHMAIIIIMKINIMKIFNIFISIISIIRSDVVMLWWVDMLLTLIETGSGTFKIMGCICFSHHHLPPHPLPFISIYAGMLPPSLNPIIKHSSMFYMSSSPCFCACAWLSMVGSDRQNSMFIIFLCLYLSCHYSLFLSSSSRAYSPPPSVQDLFLTSI